MNKKKLFDDDDDRRKVRLTVNQDYAERYEGWRKKEELQKLKNKYGDDVEDEETDESTDGEVEWDAQDEKDFLRTLGALKSNNPKIYEEDVKFFDYEREREPKKPKEKVQKEEKMTLRDYEQKLVTEREGRFSEDEDDESHPPNDPSYFEKERALKNEFKSALGESDDEDDLLKPRIKTKEQVQKEEDEYYQWIAGRKDLQEVDEDLINLKKTWTSKNLNEDDAFLRDYIMNKKYETDGDNVNLDMPTYDEIVQVDDDLAKTDEFEVKYNFRFEDPDQDFIKQFPRTVKESLRKPDTRRKEARDRVKERKDEEKKQKKEEIRQLKALKRGEIEEKLKKLREITKDEIPISIEDLEKDFDPADYDRKMKEAFSNDYYDKGEADEEKPVFSDMSDVEEDEEEEGTSAEAEDDEEGDDNEEEEVKPARKEKVSSRRHKRNSKFNEVASRKKPLFNPDKKTFEEYFDEYYALDYEDIIADNLKTKFKYREVEPNDFGLTTDEILNLDDKQLNAWVSVKKVTSFRNADEERLDRMVFNRKAQDPNKKRKVFSSVVITSKKKKTEEPPKEEKKVEEEQQPEGSKKKNRKKRKSRMDLDKNRLKAYGVSTTKLKSHLNKDKYKKKPKATS